MFSLPQLIGSRLAHRLFHPPRKQHHRSPADFGLPASTTRATTSDGIKLHLWLIPAAGTAAGTVVVGHGIGLTKSASLPHAALLHEHGFNVLLFDHRNHGLSGSDPSQEHLAERFSNDIAACVSVAHDLWPGDGRPIVWGFSFSTFPTLYSLREPTSPIRAIICDSGPGLDLLAMLSHFLTGGGIPIRGVMARVLTRPAIVANFAASAVRMLGAAWPPSPVGTAAALTPMLFLSGRDDRIVQLAQTRAIAELYHSGTLVELPGGHLRGLKTARDEYVGAVVGFLRALPK